ncbi:MAG: replication-associated recombination protein A [Chthoniobacterales bacterium]
MDDLFGTEAAGPTPPAPHAPLAERMRPRNLDEYAGQQHILGPGRLLRRAVEGDRFSSIVLYGPPGTGKTSLAGVIARMTRACFERLSGVESNVADLRRTLASAAARLARDGTRTILFVDEIHRFNKSQQDVLLPDVERGTVRLIGATTMNPFFYVNSPLVSRSMVFELRPLAAADLLSLMSRALTDPERGLGSEKIRLEDDAAEHLAEVCDGDARRCLNALELATLTTPPAKDGIIVLSRGVIEDCIQRKAIVYDAQDDAHYDTISAFIKSIRGGDPDAALYWLAKMLHAGEDIRFIARRLVIAASEDIGLADSRGLLVAVAAQQACEFVGLPEAQIPLAHATVYLATAPKSNRAYAALLAAQKDLQSGRTLAVPDHLRDKHYKGADRLGRGEGYKYSHDFPDAFIPQAYLPAGRVFYEPSDRGEEKRIAERLAHWRALFETDEANGD